MKLFTKEVDKQLFAQYPKGSDLDNQMVVAKIFNPYGRGVWYLLNSDPEDPDYIWAIVDLFEPDMGSVSRSELQTVKVPPFGLGLERDIYFTPKPAKEVFDGIMRGERFADGGRVKGRNNETGETYGVVIGSVKKSDENIEGGIEMNVRSGYSSRISEVKLVFDKNGNLYEITDYGYGLEGNYPDTSRRSGGRIYNADKKETLQVLSNMYNPAFAKKLIELAKDIKMAEGGMVQHGLKIGDKITTDMFWDNQIVVENQKTKKRAQINLETGVRKEEMGMGGDTAAAEHNIKQAKYGARLVGKQKNLDVNKNGKLDAEDFKMLRGEKMAMGGNTEKAFEVILQNPNGKMNKRAVLLAKTKDDASKKALNLKEFKQYGYVVISANEIKYAMGGKVKFEDKVKAVKKSLLMRKKVSPKVQKDYGKTYDRKEALEAAKRIVGAQTAKYESKKKFKEGGKTIAQTPAPKKDRVFGSSKNKAGSASSKKAASNIEFNESIVKTLGEKAKKYNEKHSSKVSTSTLKAVMRRGMGAYSTSHRPTITGGAPNSRQAWGYARVNKFLLKKGATKVKATYTQDDDLLENGGELKKEMRVSDKPKFKKLIELEEKVKDSMYKPSNVNNFTKWNETTGANYSKKWNKMVLKLRGWNDTEGEESLANTKKEWLDFCKEQDSVWNYNFGDVLA